MKIMKKKSFLVLFLIILCQTLFVFYEINMYKKIDLRHGDKILICRTDRIGDLVLSLPFIETIKLRYPDCPVDVMVSDYAAPVLENSPVVRNKIEIDNHLLKTDNDYKSDLRRQLISEKYAVAVVLYPEKNISQ